MPRRSIMLPVQRNLATVGNSPPLLLTLLFHWFQGDHGIHWFVVPPAATAAAPPGAAPLPLTAEEFRSTHTRTSTTYRHPFGSLPPLKCEIFHFPRFTHSTKPGLAGSKIIVATSSIPTGRVHHAVEIPRVSPCSLSASPSRKFDRYATWPMNPRGAELCQPMSVLVEVKWQLIAPRDDDDPGDAQAPVQRKARNVLQTLCAPTASARACQCESRLPPASRWRPTDRKSPRVRRYRGENQRDAGTQRALCTVLLYSASALHCIASRSASVAARTPTPPAKIISESCVPSSTRKGIPIGVGTSSPSRIESRIPSSFSTSPTVPTAQERSSFVR